MGGHHLSRVRGFYDTHEVVGELESGPSGEVLHELLTERQLYAAQCQTGGTRGVGVHRPVAPLQQLDLLEEGLPPEGAVQEQPLRLHLLVGPGQAPVQLADVQRRSGLSPAVLQQADLVPEGAQAVLQTQGLPGGRAGHNPAPRGGGGGRRDRLYVVPRREGEAVCRHRAGD